MAQQASRAALQTVRQCDAKTGRLGDRCWAEEDELGSRSCALAFNFHGKQADLDAQPPRAMRTEDVIGEGFLFQQGPGQKRCSAGCPNNKAGMDIKQDARGRWSGAMSRGVGAVAPSGGPGHDKRSGFQSCRLAQVSPLMKLSELSFSGKTRERTVLILSTVTAQSVCSTTVADRQTQLRWKAGPTSLIL